jgi:hypothetical protein
MPGPAITHHLAACTVDVFDDVTQVFRHDFNLYAGMLQSWTSLFEAEIPESKHHWAFARATQYLQTTTTQFYEQMQPRLYPQYLEPRGEVGCQHILDWWDQFYDDFSIYARPKLIRLDAQLRAYTTHPDFEHLIQASLGPAAGGEQIDRMLLRAHRKLTALLEAAQFDQRIGEVFGSQHQAR